MTPRLVESVGVLRRLEFFVGDPRSDEELAAYLAAEHEDLWGEPLDRPPPELDWQVAAYDESRVWWEDTEAGVLAGNDAYPKVIRAWAAISRGALQPRYVVEEWASEQGPVRVELSLRRGGRHVLRPRVIDDYYDLGILTQINEFLDPNGPRFVIVERFDQTAVVLAVTEAERRLLETERRWRFAGAA